MLGNSRTSAVNSTCSLSTETLTCNYVPEEIPDGVLSVTIKDFMLDKDLFVTHDELFQSESWKNVKYLTFKDDQDISSTRFILKDATLINLHQLKMLRIHMNSILIFEPNAFLGLENVNTLDFTGCTGLHLYRLRKALNGLDKVPNLEHLSLQGVYSYDGLNFDRTFISCLHGKPLKTLDFSKTHIASFEVAFLWTISDLEFINVSRVTFEVSDSYQFANVTPADVHRMGVDISYSTAGSLANPFSSNTFANLKIPFVEDSIPWSLYFALRMLNISGFNVGQPCRLYNIEIWSVHKFKILINQLIAKRNKLQRLDINLDCDNFDISSIIHFDLSENTLEYLHPSLPNCMTGLEHLDLSVNNLNDMLKENEQLFGQLLNNTERLKYISLASNQLVDLPDDFFEGNKNLVAINLAGNRLTQVHFKLHHLKHLSFIDLSSNNIRILDSMTMKQLDAMRIDLEPNVDNTDNMKMTSRDGYISSIRKVRLKGNPFSCDACETLSSIRWLVSTTITESSPDELTCKGEDDTNISLRDAVVVVEGICERKMKIIVITITSVVGSAICVGAVLMIYIRRRRALKQRRRHDIIELLRQDETRFAVFLSFCNEDDEFVQENVIGPLNDGLQRIVGTERNLNCIGDVEYRTGRYVHDEFLRCIELCTVFLCVVSDNYCNSSYCVQEFDLATQKTKPVILMMKGDVDIGLMTPTMQLLFRNQVRVLWEENNGEYRLKTSWENVCESILDIGSD
ncbi:Toll-like receptor 7 [Mactra antiquata]